MDILGWSSDEKMTISDSRSKVPGKSTHHIPVQQNVVETPTTNSGFSGMLSNHNMPLEFVAFPLSWSREARKRSRLGRSE